MVRYYGLGLLTPGVGLFHLIFSSNGIMTLSILGDRDSMPDPAFYRECIEKSFNELLAAAKARQAESVAVANKPKAKAKPVRKAKSTSSNGIAKVEKPVAKKARSSASRSAAKSSVASANSVENDKVVSISDSRG
jgi:hypothetical protein